MKQSNNTPKLRFPEFTEDWEQKKAKNIFYAVSKKGYLNMPVLSATQDKGMIKRDETGIDIKYEKESLANYKLVKNGQFVIHLRSFQGGFAYSEIDGITSPAYTILDFQDKEHSPEFWRIVLTSPNFIKRLGTVIYGIRDGRSINYKDFSELDFLVPNKQEQTTIGNFFRQIDELITLHQRKLDNVKTLKKGLLQKMFPQQGETVPQLRFPQFTDAWEQCKLGEISEKVKEKNKNKEFIETLTNSAELGVISQRDFFDKEISNIDNLTSYYIVQHNDFIYNPRISNLAPVGPIKRNKLGRTGVMSPLYYVFRLNSDVEPDYLESYFETKIWHKFMYLNGDTGARSDRFAIKDNIFIQMPIMLPPTEQEQTTIGNFFRQVDELITLHQRKLAHLKTLKKALLQQMFV